MVRVSCNSFVIILLAQLFALAQRSPEGKLTCAEIGSVRHIPFHSDEDEFHKPPAAAKPAGEADSKRGIPPTAATHQRKHPVNNGKVTQYAHDVPIG